MIKNKKATEGGEDTHVLPDNLIAIVLNLVFIAILIGFVMMYGTNTTLYEESYAKKIALAIDEAKPGTIIELDISELRKMAGKNNFELQDFIQNSIIIGLDKVQVQISSKPYKISYFTSNKITQKISGDGNNLTLTIK